MSCDGAARLRWVQTHQCRRECDRAVSTTVRYSGEERHNARLNIFILLGKITIYHADSKLQLLTAACIYRQYSLFADAKCKADTSQMAETATFVLPLQFQMRWGWALGYLRVHNGGEYLFMSDTMTV